MKLNNIEINTGIWINLYHRPWERLFRAVCQKCNDEWLIEEMDLVTTYNHDKNCYFVTCANCKKKEREQKEKHIQQLEIKPANKE